MEIMTRVAGEMYKMKSPYLLLLLCCTLLFAFTACSPKPAFVYDPAKTYAAFLVVDSDYGRVALEKMKENSLRENLEIGRIEYYKPGTQEFGLILSRLTESQQVKVVWIIAAINDINNIKAGQALLEDYKGSYRYVPIADQTGPIKLQP